MNIKEELKKLVESALESLGYETSVVIEIPKDTTHGDFSSNVAMRLAGQLKKSPVDIAEEIVEKMPDSELVEEVEVMNPGFINFKLSTDIYKKVIDEISKEKDSFGKSDFGGNKEVMIEFGQPNTHKAFHVGHLKSAVSGLSMVKLHENLGYKVIKANFFGDVGMQVAKTTWAYMHEEIPSDFEAWDQNAKMKFIDECYVKGATAFKEDPAAEKEIREINKDIYAKADNENVKIYKYLREKSLEHQSEIWKSLGIQFDREYPESEIYEKAVEIVKAHMGDIFEESEGAIIFKGEKVKLNNWVFLTSEGNPTYSAKDLGLADKKFEEYPNMEKGIVTTSVEQKDYFRAVIHILNIIKPETKGRYFHIPFGWMLRSNKKFSSRMGGSIKGMDVLNEIQEVAYKKISELRDYSEEEKTEIVKKVSIAGLKFLILSHEFHKDFNYDPEQFLSFEGYSGPYLLYTYARANSILTKSEELKEYDLKNVFKSEFEINLLRLLNQYPDTAKEAGINIAPHTICNYLYDLAQSYNTFYANCRVLNAENEEDKNARIALTQATAQVLKNGLDLLGIDVVERM
ncbi:MAG: arginine--tRNA ligase [Candidatus Dojkabacteria bacterium]